MAQELRKDITGLRAIAVISVTVYHLVHVLLPEIDYFRGGFLGVDIFFVISGYLMSMIIMRGLNKGNFNLVDFYKRRAKRICPALLVTVIIFVGLGILLVGTGDLKRMGTEGFYALLFVSNIYFAQKTDYFANSALDQVFLHTWSLSVEWQFYLFYPLILMYLKRRLSEERIALTTFILTIISLIFAIWCTTYYPRSSYYLLPSRAFELLFGALAYFYPLSYWQNKARLALELSAPKHKSLSISLAHMLINTTPRCIEALGLLIIAISFMLIDDRLGWPTAWAVLPLFGTYLCIAATNNQSLLSNQFFQKLGLWSYAIYLAHWPLIVLVTKLGFYVWSLELLIPILIIGILLHYLVERRRNYGYICLIVYALTCALTYYVGSSGVKFRLSHEANPYAQYGGHTVPFEGDVHSIGDTSKEPSFILIGDSFARHYTLDLIDRGLHVITVFRDGCYSFKNHVTKRSEGYIDDKCKGRYDSALKAVEMYPNIPVVIAQDWPRYQRNIVDRQSEVLVGEENFNQALTQDIDALSQDLALRTKSKIYVLLTPKQTIYDIGSTCMFLHALDNPLSDFMRTYFTCTPQKVLPEIKLNEFLLSELQKHDNLNYIDPNDAICTDNKCEILVGNFIPVYQDGLHYSWAGSVKVVSYILSIIGVDQGRVRVDFENYDKAQ